MSYPSNMRSAELAIEYLAPDRLIPDRANARRHSKGQLAKLKAAISAFGFNVPILTDERNKIIAGHARLSIANELGLDTVPVVRISHLTRAQKRALSIAENRIAELADWDPDALRAEFEALCKLEFPVELTGFATAEIDIILEMPGSGPSVADPADDFEEPDRSSPPVSRIGDCWETGNHLMLCGNALEEMSYSALLGDHRAAMIITDAPFNVPIRGHVSGLGKVRHREFAMATGEMSSEQFTEFLTTAMGHMARFSTDGSLHFHFMDWSHAGEIIAAGRAAYDEQKALCVWNKTNAGMGSLYRSKHELVFVFKHGRAPHQNNIQLGKLGRYRTNVWDYAGANSFGANRAADLEVHPTVKPVGLIADAVRDCSKRGDIILDPFAGSGTILLAAERTGRRAAAIELDPYYVDTAVRRWRERTRGTAKLRGTDKTFDQVAAERLDPGQYASSTTGGDHE